MKKRHAIQHEQTVSAVNATPLIDVVLCMVIFFLMVGQLAEGQRIPLELPEARLGETESPRESFIINLVPSSGGGEIAPGDEPGVVVNGESVTFAQIATMLREKSSRVQDVVVEIRAPGAAPYRWVERAMDACAEAGVRDVRLAASRAGDRP